MNLSVEIDGQHVPLDDCSWVLWGKCGCPYGVTLAGTRGGCSIITEDDAWKEFFGRKRDRDKAKREGDRMELMTTARCRAEVLDRMKVRCGHRAAS